MMATVWCPDQLSSLWYTPYIPMSPSLYLSSLPSSGAVLCTAFQTRSENISLSLFVLNQVSLPFPMCSSHKCFFFTFRGTWSVCHTVYEILQASVPMASNTLPSLPTEGGELVSVLQERLYSLSSSLPRLMRQHGIYPLVVMS